MSDSNRLKTYAALAAAPCAALGGIAAETHAAPGQVPATAQLNNSNFEFCRCLHRGRYPVSSLRSLFDR